MALPQPTTPFTAEDYLQWEAGQPDKHEFVRGEKFAAYRRIASLKEFVLIDPDLCRIEYYRLAGNQRWSLQDIETEQPLVLHELGVSIPWQKVFRNAD